ncbi:energy transducer TonB [Lacihabitans sp. LS3-19]|uniref:energy transducer TonB n=1 Tax=Lacihabitans sp. LS3-19 TaxID=2487335 RepID=UPI0020CCFFE1|nr:energy transducer TonB [Lacihabitans sp. LS3-19]MCP9767375.1 energy transducer TonB [Lacihabitans sp. LS3-19]
MKSNQNFDDIIFENRNKEYGAYFLRKNYSNYLTKAMVIGSSIFILLFGGAFTYNKYVLDKNSNKDINHGTIKLIPPPPEKPIVIPEITPPPPIKEIDIPKATITFLPPEPVIDNLDIIETPPPTKDEIEGKVISNKTNEGIESNGAFTTPPKVPEIVEIIKVDNPEDNKIFISVEQKPEFPNGTKAMYEFLSKNIHYPKSAVNAGVTGKVFVKFVVEKDGSIADVQITKGIGFGCDEEAIRVIQSMPKWRPGRQNGKEVRVYFNMPITYKLD